VCKLKALQHQQQQQGTDKEKKKKETILDLSKYLDKSIRVKFAGGREGVFAKCFFIYHNCLAYLQ